MLYYPAWITLVDTPAWHLVPDEVRGMAFIHQPLRTSVLFLAVALALGCASAITPAQTSPTGPIAPSPAATSAATASVGTSVGDRVPDFTMRLVDGSTITTDDLAHQDRATFLFFVATW